VLVGVVLMNMASSAFGQPALNIGSPAQPGVTVTASETIQLEPSVIRLRLRMAIEGRDGKTALDTLHDHQQRVEKELVFLGATKEAIEFSEANVIVEIPGVVNFEQARKSSQQQMAQMRNMNPQMKMAGGDEEISEADLPHIHTARSWVKADWAITSPIDDKTRILPSNLKRQVIEKDLKGQVYTEKLTPQEQVMVRSLSGSNFSYSVPNAADSNCRFVFVAKLSDEQLAKATNLAMAKAKKKAEQMATTAGASLGKVIGVSQTIARAPGNNYGHTNWNPYVTVYQEMDPAATSSKDDEREFTDLDQRLINVGLTVTYELK
jgi:uncharacterized protein YggE